MVKRPSRVHDHTVETRVHVTSGSREKHAVRSLRYQGSTNASGHVAQTGSTSSFCTAGHNHNLKFDLGSPKGVRQDIRSDVVSHVVCLLLSSLQRGRWERHDARRALCDPSRNQGTCTHLKPQRP